MSAPIRVFHLIKGLGRGGAETLLAEGLRVADHTRFRFGYGYFLPWKDAMVGSLEEQHAEVACFSARSSARILLSVQKVAGYLRTWKADLLHCHLPLAGAVGRLAGKLAGVPVVYTEHNKMERYHPLTRRLNLATWSWQHQVIAVSSDVARSIDGHAGAGVPVKVVLNGINVGWFSRDGANPATVRRQLGIPRDAFIVGTVAVFRAQKRLEDWLEAARRLRDRHGNIHFLLVGDGPVRDDLTALVTRLQLEDVVHFTGLQQDVRPYLAATDVYVISSQFEGLPLALLEAMAMQCTVVSTAVGGIPEVIRDGENGFLVEPLDPERLADVTGKMLASPETRRRCGAAARQTVEERFGMRRMARELESTYLEVLARYRNGH